MEAKVALENGSCVRMREFYEPRFVLGTTFAARANAANRRASLRPGASGALLNTWKFRVHP